MIGKDEFTREGYRAWYDYEAERGVAVVLDKAEVRVCQIRGCDFESGRLPISSLYAGSGRWLEMFVCPEHRDLLPNLVLPQHSRARKVSWFACRCDDRSQAAVVQARGRVYRHYRSMFSPESILAPSISDLIYALESFGVRSIEAATDQWALVTSTDEAGRRVSISCDDVEDGLILSFDGWVLQALMAAMRME